MTTTLIQTIAITMTNKDKHYQALIEELNELSQKKQESDRVEINELNFKINQLQEKLDKKVSSNLLKSSPNSSSFFEENSEPSGLKYENKQLSKQLEELKFSYDDLIDEKNQLLLTLNELKQKVGNASQTNGAKLPSSDINEVIRLNTLLKDRDKVIIDLETKLALLRNQQGQRFETIPLNSPSPRSSSSAVNYFASKTSLLSTDLNDSRHRHNSALSMCLESTEIDYLRQIVYSYMMGTDPLVCSLLMAFYFYPCQKYFLLLIYVKLLNHCQIF